MVEHRMLTHEELDEHDRQQDLDYLTALAPSSRPLSATAALILAMDGPRRRRYDCTGFAARWCPIHGDCKCDHSEGDEYPGVDEDGTPCHLHSPTSTHPQAHQ